ncbi:hypothetical protein GO730_31950 [Spirosoma sp. HMF3257]|uniref:Uncharacterized protein n=1 Tax=Spirosoma telluris TaxID=2183553 RepID=A0A327NUS2_9BACT|nr:hypothetical protein [Spirosoma telluris]RAI77604.1 hypothetical protein HMF3257_31845 [Spirosoma telluris]
MKRQLRYADAGRSGTIRYISKQTQFDLWYEFAGGNAIVIIGIPSPQHWEFQTKTALSQRTKILNFIGKQVINDRIQGDGYFSIDDTILTIYSGRDPR